MKRPGRRFLLSLWDVDGLFFVGYALGFLTSWLSAKSIQLPVRNFLLASS